MNDVTTRALVITAVVTVALLIAWALERRRATRPRRIAASGLQPGIYLFTSEKCPDCASARQALVEALGEQGFVEVTWSDSPTVFERLEIAAVPASLIVDEDGSARCWFGRPDRLLAARGP
jgi:hypothetical protein